MSFAVAPFDEDDVVYVDDVVHVDDFDVDVTWIC